MDLKELREEMAKDLYAFSLSKAWERGICIECRQNALSNCYSEDGRREYKISGLCELCFDRMHVGKEEEDDDME